MTETQAKSGNKGTSANPVDEEAAQGGTPATGRRGASSASAATPAQASPKSRYDSQLSAEMCA
ncbi:hypothetical protein ABZV78_09165, partial [Micromonospora sp. NPDC004540]